MKIFFILMVVVGHHVNIIFISKTEEDQTKEFITLDKNNNCLVESDSKRNLIYARKLFNKNKKDF